MLTITSDDATGVVEITVDGAIGRAEFDRVVTELERLLETHRQLNVVEVIRDFAGIDPALWWRNMAWSLGHIHRFARAAVVTDSGWIGPVARSVGALMPSEIRTFPMERIAEARRWAAERR
ncbi:STAS/SEC14 domain-containing protein [Sphingomonas sp.]|uniref:STAS/SEC14 domain-containing protein n=1 Tax=Sphingomonas sp. TaxID=28214 RepID=UPI002CAE36B9|nr:STAS/SEC14 domain-containing protein [Sphingomonas sp.]HWK35399.1 STAS/SEC14 domain-containing protein [Sphingomonas sp.]